MKDKKKIRVMIVDDHSITREGLKTVISVYDDMEYAGDAINGKDVLEKYKKIKPDIIIMDIEMPILDGISATKIIKKDSPDINIIALTSFSDKKLIRDAIRAGAIGYIQKNISPDELAEVIRDAYNGKPNLSLEAINAIMADISESSEKDNNLTGQELKVLGLIVKGFSNKDIAKELFLSPHTIKFHISNILSKLGVATRSEAAVIAVRKNLID